MGSHQRSKGIRFELRVVKDIREAVGLSDEQCFRGGYAQAQSPSRLPDVVSPELWIECGHGKRMDGRRKLEQAIAARSNGLIPVAVTRRDRQPIEVTIRLRDVVTLLGRRVSEPCPVTMGWGEFLDIYDRWYCGEREAM